MKSFVRTFFSAVSIAALGLTASSALAQGAGEIVVYNAQHETLAKSWAEAFTADTGIKVVLRNGGDTQLGNQLVQEGAASSADVFLTENSPAMVLVDNAKLFAPVEPATLDLVPEEYRPSHGRWIGIAARSTVFVYDKRKLDQAKLPASIMDLADASWKGRWAASPSGADFQAIVSAILEIKGPAATQAWLTAMKQNSVVLRGNVAAMKAVNAGEVEGAVIYHYYWFGDQAKTGENSGNVGVHYFRNKDAGAFVSISGGGVLASSKNQPQAQAFLKWIVTKGQNILRTGNSYEYAVAKGAASNDRLPPLVDLQAPKIDPAKLNSRAVSDMMTAAGLL
ncbi:MAG: iron transporter substrate-binding protein [Hyphomicrobiales bacterium]|nr:iron transporter substrate-binding protein [Hyphomicrobiales bacterium]